MNAGQLPQRASNATFGGSRVGQADSDAAETISAIAEIAIDHAQSLLAALLCIGSWDALDHVSGRILNTMTAITSGAEHELDYYSRGE